MGVCQTSELWTSIHLSSPTWVIALCTYPTTVTERAKSFLKSACAARNRSKRTAPNRQRTIAFGPCRERVDACTDGSGCCTCAPYCYSWTRVQWECVVERAGQRIGRTLDGRIPSTAHLCCRYVISRITCLDLLIVAVAEIVTLFIEIQRVLARA